MYQLVRRLTPLCRYQIHSEIVDEHASLVDSRSEIDFEFGKMSHACTTLFLIVPSVIVGAVVFSNIEEDLDTCGCPERDTHVMLRTQER